jgi:hypothetical protein
MSASNFSIY